MVSLEEFFKDIKRKTIAEHKQNGDYIIQLENEEDGKCIIKVFKPLEKDGEYVSPKGLNYQWYVIAKKEYNWDWETGIDRLQALANPRKDYLADFIDMHKFDCPRKNTY